MTVLWMTMCNRALCHRGKDTAFDHETLWDFSSLSIRIVTRWERRILSVNGKKTNGKQGKLFRLSFTTQVCVRSSAYL